MNNRIDMSAFIGRVFDVEFYVGLDCGPIGESSRPVWSVNKIDEIDSSDEVIYHDNNLGAQTYICRPRLNKPQVLDDYSWLPDGLVWVIHYLYLDYNQCDESFDECTSNQVKKLIEDDHNILTISCKGLEKDYAEQAKEWDCPVVEL